MAAWSTKELDKIGGAEELRVSGRRRDGTLRDPVTIWVVRRGDDLYVRSVRGQDGNWYRGAQVRHEGHIRAGGIDKDVSFVSEPDPGTNADIDSAYRTKYASYSRDIVDPMLAAGARATTTKLVPR